MLITHRRRPRGSDLQAQSRTMRQMRETLGLVRRRPVLWLGERRTEPGERSALVVYPKIESFIIGG